MSMKQTVDSTVGVHILTVWNQKEESRFIHFHNVFPGVGEALNRLHTFVKSSWESYLAEPIPTDRMDAIHDFFQFQKTDHGKTTYKYTLETRYLKGFTSEEKDIICQAALSFLSDPVSRDAFIVKSGIPPEKMDEIIKKIEYEDLDIIIR